MAEHDNLVQDLEKIRLEALDDLNVVRDEKDLQAWRSKHLGRSAPFMQVFTRMGEVPKEQRPFIGQAANKVKVELESALEARQSELKQEMLRKTLEGDRLDITLPGRAITTRGYGMKNPALTVW